MIYLLQVATIPENPTLNWALLIAVSALVSAVIFLFKQMELHRRAADEIRDKHEERLLIHAKDIQGLLERTLLSFSEVEKSIIETDGKHLEKLKGVMTGCQNQIISEMAKLSDKLDKNGKE